MSVKQAPCPQCGSHAVWMCPAYGGRGTGETTSYTGGCQACGYRLEELPSNADGRKASAIREWNRVALRKAEGGEQ